MREKKPLPKTKTTSRSKKKPKLKTRADALEQIQMYARLSRADANGNVRCITCGKVFKWNEVHGGHFIANKGHYATAHLVDNIFPQCYVCNVCNHGEQLKYYMALREKFGPEYPERLINIDKAYNGDDKAYMSLNHEDRKLARTPMGFKIKLSKYEWDEMYRYYASENRRLKCKLGS